MDTVQQQHVNSLLELLGQATALRAYLPDLMLPTQAMQQVVGTSCWLLHNEMICYCCC